MSSVLKVDEWQAGRQWYVADVKTWTNWRGMAGLFNVDLDGFCDLLRNKYHCEHIEYFEETPSGTDLLRFSFNVYKNAHQLKLDVNRIARKTGYEVEEAAWRHRNE